MKALAEATSGQFQPVPLPDPNISGYKFPETEDTILAWTRDNNQRAMNLHAWGIWTALTQMSNQSFNGQKLRVFETWYNPSDLMSGPGGQARVRQPRRLEVPRQFEHGGSNSLFNADLSRQPVNVSVDVKYDPTGSEHILKNNLFSSAQLTTLLNNHNASVPDFPGPSIALKPFFTEMPASQLVDRRYFKLPSWPGPPPLNLEADGLYHSIAFPPSAWQQCVWIDIQDTGRKPGTTVDKTCAKNGSSRTGASTYGLDEFIHFQLSQQDADFANADAKRFNLDVAPASAGDYAVLVGLHVTSREITRWTWQTFWWTYNPAQPFAPSSPAIAANRPSELRGPARNYAQCVGYDEVSPPQPNSGGSNTGESVYCYNPYLEAHFGPKLSPLKGSLWGTTRWNGRLVKTANDVGVQTNCMSCHEQAHFPNQGTPPLYTGDRYIDLTGPAFKGVLKVDFLWSIADDAQ